MSTSERSPDDAGADRPSTFRLPAWLPFAAMVAMAVTTILLVVFAQ